MNNRPPKLHTLSTLPLSNSFAQLASDFYSRVQPTAFESESTLIHFNPDVAKLLGLESTTDKDPLFNDVFTGKHLLPGSDPLAMLYAGHQFGHLVPQLGDGRAIILGETTDQNGEKWEMQLKGSGETPYSRSGDGRAVLRSTIREYLCSEAMHGLGIPTTRALCIIGSQDEVYRETIETGAMLTRVAPSHVRFGSFEVFFYRNQHEQIKTLADYVITQHYPELAEKEDKYSALLESVLRKTALLMAQWQSVGFAHGVMNTDNMSILGLTLDYGPFGFMEGYDPKYICNHSDHQGRYAFDQQPQIGLWNLSCLAQALTPLISVEKAQAILGLYADIFSAHYRELMLAKLGFDTVNEDSWTLLGQLLEMMRESQADYTNTFRALSQLTSESHNLPLRNDFLDRERFDRWLDDYLKLSLNHGISSQLRENKMKKVNPRYILRNYMAQTAIEKAQNGDFSEIERLMTLLKSPFDDQPEMSAYAKAPPDWAKTLEISCSS